MPQLSLYLDEETLRNIETRAKVNNTSVSKFVAITLKEHFSKNWPEGYKKLFGSVSDETFVKPESLDFSCDTGRESL